MAEKTFVTKDDRWMVISQCFQGKYALFYLIAQEGNIKPSFL
jgi:hypothetical protein